MRGSEEGNSGEQSLPLLHDDDGHGRGSSLRLGTCLAFVLQALVVLELVSLLFFVTLLLYWTRARNADRNRDAVGLFLYVLLVMAYDVWSLQAGSGLAIGVRVLAAVTKALASSLFFAFSLQHPVLLPAFFFYFFPAALSASISIVLP